MGTRHLISVYCDGQPKIAQYGQWDGYPEGQGVKILEFLREPKNQQMLREKSKLCRWITNEEMKATWLEFGHDPETSAGFVSCEIADKRGEKYPHLDRDAGAKILELVVNSNGLPLVDSTSFAADSLFCEWAYVIDFDSGVLEVYKGFNQTPHAGQRFSELKQDQPSEYCPVALAEYYPLDALPDAEQFTKETNPQEQEE